MIKHNSFAWIEENCHDFFEKGNIKWVHFLQPLESENAMTKTAVKNTEIADQLRKILTLVYK